jgi:hypothetical protein
MLCSNIVHDQCQSLLCKPADQKQLKITVVFIMVTLLKNKLVCTDVSTCIASSDANV